VTRSFSLPIRPGLRESPAALTLTGFMSITNSYSQPPEEDLSSYYGPDPYDINFVFPIQSCLDQFESDCVKLTPFIPRIHAQSFVERLSLDEAALQWMPLRSLTLAEVLPQLETHFRQDPGYIAFAIIDKGRNNALAGFIALGHTSVSMLATEISWIIVLPEFRRSYVTTHAVGIILRVCLELPSAGGLGLRRVQWCAQETNHKSINAAQRLGFTLEGTLRWTKVLLDDKEGYDVAPRKGDPSESGPGRGSVTLAMCWDDWENGKREHVQKLMER
jgi:RimJ/RimL family protein N-acetyltransferase